MHQLQTYSLSHRVFDLSERLQTALFYTATNRIRRSCSVACDLRVIQDYNVYFLPRCILCRAILGIRKMSARLSVHPSVERVNCDKTKETSAHTLYHRKDRLSCSLPTQVRLAGIPLVPEILAQTGPIFNRFSLMAHQP